MSSAADRCVVIGVGNALRGDDAAGLLVARRVRDRGADAAVFEHEGDPTGILPLLSGAGAAILVDSMCSRSAPGTVRRFEAGAAPLPCGLYRSASTHAFGLEAAVELARALDRLPPTVVVFGIEGACFDTGAGCTPAVSAGIERAADAVLHELEGPRGGPPDHALDAAG